MVDLDRPHYLALKQLHYLILVLLHYLILVLLHYLLVINLLLRLPWGVVEVVVEVEAVDVVSNGEKW